MPKTIRIRAKDYVRLENYSKKHGIAMVETLDKALSKLEVKPLESEIEGKIICGECDEEIQSDAFFCPYCGAEFETDKAGNVIMEESEEESDDESE